MAAQGKIGRRCLLPVTTTNSLTVSPTFSGLALPPVVPTMDVDMKINNDIDEKERDRERDRRVERCVRVRYC